MHLLLLLLLLGSEEADAGQLLGLHQLFQALQHGQTQGLEPGGRHSQEDHCSWRGPRGGDKLPSAHPGEDQAF